MKKHTIAIGPGVAADLDKLLTSRLLVQATSGAGKSWLLRRLLEQSHGMCQQIVIDPEGEFSTLRESFDYVLAAKAGGDTLADVRTAKLLAERLLELGVSAIIDIYELNADQRVKFVRLFLEALVDAPKHLWHPVLVVLDEAHTFCLDDKTEILTDAGWQRHETLQVGTNIVAFDPTTASYRTEPASAVIRMQHDGPMVRLRSDGIDCVVTPYHRVVLRREQRAAGRNKLYDWTFCEASKTPHQVHVPIGGADYGAGLGLSADFMRLLGWVATDGTQERKRGYISISQSVKTVKKGMPIAAEMERVLTNLGCKGVYRRPTRSSATRAGGRKITHAPSTDFYLGVALSARVRSFFGADVHRIPRRVICEASFVELQALYQGLLEGDGTAVKGEWRAFYPGHNEGLADDFQEIATRLGISVTKKRVPQNGQWTVLISRRSHHYIRRPEKATYSGVVWCVTVPSGAFVARRRGKVFVTGNCPEKGSGEAESATAVKALCTRGRKRGFCAVLATQRLPTLSKDAAAMCANKLIGRASLDTDLTRSGAELGFGRADSQRLRDLDDGEFYAFGPAISKTVTKVKVGPVQTTHPEAGSQLAARVPPPTAKVKALLPQLSDLPAEAEDRERSLAELKSENARLKHDLAKAEHAAPATEVKTVAALTDADRMLIEKLAGRLAANADAAKTTLAEAEAKCVAVVTRAVNDFNMQMGEVAFGEAENMTAELEKASVRKLIEKLNGLAVPAASAPVRQNAPPRAHTPPHPRQTAILTDIQPPAGDLDRAQQKILDVVAMLIDVRGLAPNRDMVARWLDIHPNGGRYGQNLGFLREQGYLSPRGFELTDAGRRAAQPMVCGLPGAKVPLDGAQAAIVDTLNDHRGTRFTRDTLAEQLGLHPNGGRYGQNLGRLRTMGLIPERGDIYLVEAAYR